MGEHAASQADPPEDTHGDAAYRRRLTATLVSRALAEAAGGAIDMAEACQAPGVAQILTAASLGDPYCSRSWSGTSSSRPGCPSWPETRSASWASRWLW
jgi:hypothetical protein